MTSQSAVVDNSQAEMINKKKNALCPLSPHHCKISKSFLADFDPLTYRCHKKVLDQ